MGNDPVNMIDPSGGFAGMGVGASILAGTVGGAIIGGTIGLLTSNNGEGAGKGALIGALAGAFIGSAPTLNTSILGNLFVNSISIATSTANIFMNILSNVPQGVTTNYQVRIHVGLTYKIGDDPDYKNLYYTKGGHVGIEYNGSVYNYYYNPGYSYKKVLKLFKASMYKVTLLEYLQGDGNHTYANGDMDGDGIADIKGSDSYFTLNLTEKQYLKLGKVLEEYNKGMRKVPKYGILGKRCTSMVHTALRKAGIRPIILGFLRVFSPHQYYKYLKKRGYVETVINP